MEGNAAIEIHDSTLQSIELHGDALVAVLSAYVHRSPGRPGVDPGTVWLQTIELRFDEGHVTGNHEALPMKLLDGHLDVPGQNFHDLIPVPFKRVGAARLKLGGWNGTRVVVDGASLQTVFIGQPRYVEQFSRTEGSTP